MSRSSKSDFATPLSCPHCAGPLSKDVETSRWTVAPLVRDSFYMIGSAVGGTTSAFYGFNYDFNYPPSTAAGREVIEYFYNLPKARRSFPGVLIAQSEASAKEQDDMSTSTVMPTVRKWIKGPIWLHFLVGTPPVLVFSSACAGLSGGAVPALAQLASSSYHAAMSSPSLTPSEDDRKHQSASSSTL